MSVIVTPRQLTQRGELYHQLATLLAAGLGLLQALETIARNPPGIAFRRPLNSVLARINEGATFTEALLGQGRWLPVFDLALIQAGEQSGRLVECFRLLEHHYAERAQLARRVL